MGDITPQCGVSKEEKLRRERNGMEVLLDTLGNETSTGSYFLSVQCTVIGRLALKAESPTNKKVLYTTYAEKLFTVKLLYQLYNVL